MPRIKYDLYKKLLPKYKIDLWGAFAKKKKLNWRLYKSILYRFEQGLRSDFLPRVRSFASQLPESQIKSPIRFSAGRQNKVAYLKNAFYACLHVYYDFYASTGGPTNSFFTL
jgi:hypothetical protein